jgi:hypothetical protein
MRVAIWDMDYFHKLSFKPNITVMQLSSLHKQSNHLINFIERTEQIDDDFDLIGFDDLGDYVDDMDNNLDDKDEKEKGIKYLLEIEFADEQSRKDEYENLVSQGLIVRFKNG